jgi:hypothetical protein
MTGHWNSNNIALQAEKDIGPNTDTEALPPPPQHFNYRKYLHVLLSLWPAFVFSFGVDWNQVHYY